MAHSEAVSESKGIAKRSSEVASLIERVANLRPRKEFRPQRAYLRFLRRAVRDVRFANSLHSLRDTILRTSIGREKNLVVALSGVDGAEGASTLSLLLALSLGACVHRRIAFLDGRLDVARFQAVSSVLDLSRNQFSVHKGVTEVWACYNAAQPNVNFLTSAGSEQGLQFYSDKQLTDFLEKVRRSFDFTIIDMPPLLKESGNVFLAPEVDLLYLVVSAARTRLSDIDKCRETIAQTGSEISGVIVNRQTAPLWSRLWGREYYF